MQHKSLKNMEFGEILSTDLRPYASRERTIAIRSALKALFGAK